MNRTTGIITHISCIMRVITSISSLCAYPIHITFPLRALTTIPIAIIPIMRTRTFSTNTSSFSAFGTILTVIICTKSSTTISINSGIITKLSIFITCSVKIASRFRTCCTLRRTLGSPIMIIRTFKTISFSMTFSTT